MPKLEWLELTPTLDLEINSGNCSNPTFSPSGKSQFAKLCAEKLCDKAHLTNNLTLKAEWFDVWQVFDLPYDSPKYMLLEVKYSKDDSRPYFRDDYFTDHWLTAKLRENSLSSEYELHDFCRCCYVVSKTKTTMYLFDNDRGRLAIQFNHIAEVFAPTVEEEQEEQMLEHDELSDRLIDAFGRLFIK